MARERNEILRTDYVDQQICVYSLPELQRSMTSWLVECCRCLRLKVSLDSKRPKRPPGLLSLIVIPVRFRRGRDACGRPCGPNSPSSECLMLELDLLSCERIVSKSSSPSLLSKAFTSRTVAGLSNALPGDGFLCRPSIRAADCVASKGVWFSPASNFILVNRCAISVTMEKCTRLAGYTEGRRIQAPNYWIGRCAVLQSTTEVIWRDYAYSSTKP